jgi:uncharacterized protein (DUF1786 family)
MIQIRNQGASSILAVDVGAGTQDILFFNPAKAPENNIKLVLPSQTQILAKSITKLDKDLLISGEIMGGGPVTMAILAHLKKGHRVVMTETSAKTVRDDLDQVREEGIEIVADADAKGLEMARIEAKDFDLDFLFKLVSYLGDGLPEFIGVAVQDHGFEKNKSDRKFRFEMIKEMLVSEATLEDFLFKDPPDYYTRMNAVMRYVKRNFSGGVAVMDSKFAAIAGALHGVSERPCMCIDVGNGHTMAAVIDDGIESVFEHHTHSLSKGRLTDYITRLANGNITNEEVYNDQGHGCFIKRAPEINEIEKILVTGPNRNMLKDSGLPIEFARPFGDVMMTGAVGIVDLIRSKFY